MQLVCGIARRNILFTRVCLHLSLMLLQRFGSELVPVCQEIIKTQLESIIDQDMVKMEMFDKLKETPKGRRQLTKKRMQLGNKVDGSASYLQLEPNDDLADDSLLSSFLTGDLFNQEAIQY